MAWIEDYQSPDESSSVPTEVMMNEIIKRCKEQLKTRGKVRIGYVVFDVCQVHVSNSVLIEVLFRLEQTGKYQHQVIKMKEDGSSDFVVGNKPWKESNWLLIAIFTYIIGVATPIVIKSIEKRILPESSQLKPTIPAKTDTVPRIPAK